MNVRNVTVMTFNLRRQSAEDEGNAWSFRKGYAAEVVKRYRPTVAGTQEGLYDMLEYLDRELPEYARVGEGRNGGTENEYNAIFYRKEELAVREWGQFWLSEYPSEPREMSWGATHHRICTWAHFQTRNEPQKQFLHYNTHLDHSSQLARAKGSVLLWERLSDHKNRLELPALLTGDLNAEPDNPVIAFLRGQTEVNGAHCALKDVYSVLAGNPGLSFHGFKGGEEGGPIDYIFVTPDVHVDDVAIIRDMFDGKLPSDHYPVLAKIRL